MKDILFQHLKRGFKRKKEETSKQAILKIVGKQRVMLFK
jgi:hypothetical protein